MSIAVNQIYTVKKKVGKKVLMSIATNQIYIVKKEAGKKIFS